MPKARKTDFETPQILSDAPLSTADPQAHFHFDEFAATLARLIADKKTLTPLTIGVSGAWGSGKTTLLRRVQRQLDQTLILLEKEKPVEMDFANPGENPEKQFRVCRTVWFNAWKYADEDALLVALVRTIVQTMSADTWVTKAIGKLLDPAYPRRDVVNTVLGWFSIKIGEASIGLDTGDPKPTAFAEKTALLDLFDDAFDRLMAAWVHQTLNVDKIDPKRGVLVVFIDDLDRCLPAKAVQVLEAIKLFLDKPGCVFVLGADTEVVRQAVESHYQNAKVTGQRAEDYLEKVLQLRFNLPPVADTVMQEFLKTHKVVDEMLAEWRPLLAAAEVNPRRVKAVLNDIALQWCMLVNSEQAQGVQRADFIRWSALLRAAPQNFRERVFDIDDLDLRLKFVQDALRWGSGEGDETLERTFQEYEKASRRLRRVLRQIEAFSAGFNADTLNAFIHLVAPQPKTVTPPLDIGNGEVAPNWLEEMAQETTKGEQYLRVKNHPSRRTWGGIEFVNVPAGKFLMGSKEDNSRAYNNEKPQHTVEMPAAYYIGRFPVTNAQFAVFVKASGYKTTAEEAGFGRAWDGKEWKDVKGANWQHPNGPERNIDGKQDHPVVQVSWHDAQAYCTWLNDVYGADLHRGLQFRLPSEAEWEKAARGEYGAEWSWGNKAPDANRCNFNLNIGDTTPVGNYSPQNDSPYGCADMVGNVCEWTHTLFENYPYAPKDGRESETSPGLRILRGGSFYSNAWSTRCAFRDANYSISGNFDYGFRVLVASLF